MTRFSIGFALLAATACTQIPTNAPINVVPLEARGASSVSYDRTAALPRSAPPLATRAPVAQTYAPAPVVQTYAPVSVPAPVAYAPTVAVPQSSRYTPAVRVQAAPQPRAVVPAPAYVAAPAPAYIPAPAPQYTPAPTPIMAPDVAAAAPAAEARALTTRERVAALGEPEALPQSQGRQFQIIEVAELTGEASSPVRNTPSTRSDAGGLRITSSEPFSISTGTTGKPYYQGSTPPTLEYHIPHIPQEEPLWCWAAAAQQAIGWVNNGRAPAQCAIVALAHGLDINECCADRDGICARTGEIPAIEKLVERFGGQGQELAVVPRDPQTIYDILSKGDTLLIRLRPAPHDEAVGIRHMIVVRGIEWLRLPNNQLQATLLYNDPLGANERAVNFDEIEGFFEQALVISRS